MYLHAKISVFYTWLRICKILRNFYESLAATKGFVYKLDGVDPVDIYIMVLLSK